jgi:3-hydroxyisobutyrate dehydrogenase-like beta-hydroxyacid dehydrogenase
MMAKGLVGFIGLGTIGTPMAENILRAGNPLSVFDLAPGAVERLVREGAMAAENPRDAARDATCVITILPDSPDVEAAYYGADGLLTGLSQGAVYIDMSTVDPAGTQRRGADVARAGAAMVDAPVGRTVDHARQGKLSIMVGGEREVVDRVWPILSVLGDQITYCGPLGSGHAMKLVNNYISAGIVGVMSEALSFGVHAGLSAEDIVSVVGGTMAGNGLLTQVMAHRAFRDDFSLGFKTTLSRKDQGLGVRLGQAAGLDCRIGRAVLTLLDEAIARGFGNDDFTSMLRVNEQQAGVQVRLRNGRN